jgi:hypothetical protein
MPRKKPSETRQARQFGLILTGLLLALAAAFQFLGGHPLRAKIAVGVAAGVAALTLLAFPLWLIFFRRWMKFANVMGTVMSMVILTLFFFLFFTPIVLFMRLIGKKMLDMSWKDGRTTYWIDKQEAPATLERYQRQF